MEKKKVFVGMIIGCLILFFIVICCVWRSYLYHIVVLTSDNEYRFDDTYRAYLTDSDYGSLRIKFDKKVHSWVIYGHLKKAGQTQFVVESPSGDKKLFDITIKEEI